jgi:hypothetical protein
VFVTIRKKKMINWVNNVRIDEIILQT